MENNISLPNDEVQKSKLALFFSDKKNIFALIALVFGFVSLIVFLVTPVVQIDLTDLGLSVANNKPSISGYHEVIYGFELLFGGKGINVLYQQSSVVVDEIRTLRFNYMILISLILILGSSICLLVMTILKKNGILNKIVLAGFIVGAILLLLTVVWFYAINGKAPSNLTGYIDTLNKTWTATKGPGCTEVTIYNTLASTYYVTQTTTYPYGLINAHMDIGSILSFLFALISAVFSGLLISKPVETR